MPSSRIAVIDVEASGFGRGSYPIEIGAVLPDGTSECCLVYPSPEWTHWDSGAEAAHGISRELLLAHGRPVRDVALRFNDLLVGQTVYSDAWSFDLSWLGALFEAADIVQRFRLESLTTLLTEAERDAWGAAKHRVTANLGLSRHRASSDALILQQTFEELRQRRA
jgi:hypothetical protein